MPELPEVETTRRGVEPYITGKTVERIIIRQHQLRWPIPRTLSNSIKGETILSVSRRGKYLLIEFKKGHLLVHLGMSGSLRVVEPGLAAEKHDHGVFHIHLSEVRVRIVLSFGVSSVPSA